MSYSTTNAFIHTGNWDEETRSHPAVKFLEDYAAEFDKSDWSIEHEAWTTADWELQKADGTTFHGAKESYDAVKELYGPLTAFLHEASFLIAWDTKEGWDVVGFANLFMNLPGESQGQKVKDEAQGKSWDLMVPTAFRFTYVKDSRSKHDGILLKKTVIYADSGPVVMGLLKRGVLKPEQLVPS